MLQRSLSPAWMCMCVCSSPHYSHCVDLSSRVTPEARSPVSLRSDALNYTTFGGGRGSSAFHVKSAAVFLTETSCANGVCWIFPGAYVRALHNHQYEAAPHSPQVPSVERCFTLGYFKFCEGFLALVPILGNYVCRLPTYALYRSFSHSWFLQQTEKKTKKLSPLKHECSIIPEGISIFFLCMY